MSRFYLETIKALDGELFHIEYHQQRLNKSLQDDTIYPLKKLLSPPKKGLYRCRVVYDVETFSVEYIPYVKREVNSLKIIYNDTIEYEKKYADRDSIDELFALRDKCDDILIVKGGLIRDTSIANVAFYDGKEWLTPKRPLLNGVTRQRYIDNATLTPVDIFVDDLRHFSQVALLNAMIDFDIIAQDNLEEIIC